MSKEYFMFSYVNMQQPMCNKYQYDYQPTIINFIENKNDNFKIVFELSKLLTSDKLHEVKLSEEYVNTFLKLSIPNTLVYKIDGTLNKSNMDLIDESFIKQRKESKDSWLHECHVCYQDKYDMYGNRAIDITYLFLKMD
jgi:hypothetical protein